jgi:hypothetical protein
VGGTYTSFQSVTISDTLSGAAIYYTTNATTPTTASTLYTAPISVTANETLKAVAFYTGYANSATAAAAYTINLPTAATPTISPNGGTFTSAQSVTIADSVTGAAIYYTVDGTTPTATSNLYTGPITVATSQTVKAIAIAAQYKNSAVASAVFTIAVPTPTIAPAGGTFTTIQSVTLSDTMTGVAIYYTTNATTPTSASTIYTGPISVSASETIKAIAVCTGYGNSAVASSAFTINLPIAPTPTISPNGGTFASAQSITLSDTVTGASIYYTTDGTTPTASSNLYSGAIPVAATETIKAIAIATGYRNSATASVAFTIEPYQACTVRSPLGS